MAMDRKVATSDAWLYRSLNTLDAISGLSMQSTGSHNMPCCITSHRFPITVRESQASGL